MKRAWCAAGASRFLLLGLGDIIPLLGVTPAIGDVKLVSLGGSWYFLVGSAIWAVVKVGLVFSRLLMFSAIGMVVAVVYPLLVSKPLHHCPPL